MNQVKGSEFLLRSWDVAGVSAIHTQRQGPGELGESKKELGFGEQASARMWAHLVPWLHSESHLDYCSDHGRPLMSMDGVERVRVTSADTCACRKCCHTTLSMGMEDRDSRHLNEHSSLLLYFCGNCGWMWEMTSSMLLPCDLTRRTCSSFCSLSPPE